MITLKEVIEEVLASSSLLNTADEMSQQEVEELGMLIDDLEYNVLRYAANVLSIESEHTEQ